MGNARRRVDATGHRDGDALIVRLGELCRQYAEGGEHGLLAASVGKDLALVDELRLSVKEGILDEGPTDVECQILLRHEIPSRCAWIYTMKQ